ncbi:MAG: PspC domain-containing protein [Cyclobacteriaceae bacterium]|nr:PspC domain-containing protein [Cyclobacteriaceae bacterium]UYN87838.1 MAG: PspC domain-containing protein [Cyclobacteriaceae bacterium]
MKKNISINISGIIFHIEEDGYEVLKKYLDSINKYFSTFEDSSEILPDIESRIAEIFLGKLNEGKQVITLEDVNNLKATMGSVSDFKAAEQEDYAQADAPRDEKKSESTGYSSTASRQFMRDQKRKILGGVCAGLGNYFNVDPVWIRLLFALLTFAYGIILIAYVVLWIIVPGSDDLEEPTITKKLFRNTDKKVIGGVASGLAAYLKMDVIIVRLIFIITAFFGGIGFIAYIVFWIVVPEARSITDKMQMQGEPVTLSNIESNIKKGQDEQPAEEESVITKILLFPFRAIGWVLTGLGKIIDPIADVLRVGIGIFIMLFGLSLVLSVLIAGGALFGLFTFSSAWVGWQDVSLPMEAFSRAVPPITAVMAFIGGLIPGIIIMLLGISTIANRIVFGAAVGWSMFIMFFLSIIVLSFSVPKIAIAFREDGETKVEQTYDLGGKTAVLNMRETGLDDYKVTSLTLKGYEGTSLKLVQLFEARGSSRLKAIENAQMVEYMVAQQDSILTFDSNIRFKDDAIFRAQRLNLTLYIPYDYPFVLDGDIWRLVNQYIDRDSRNGNTWVIGKDGYLTCTTCPEQQRSESSFEDQDWENDIDETDGVTTSNLTDFNELEISGLFDLYIKQGNGYEVELIGPASEKEKYKVVRMGNTLVIDYSDEKRFRLRKNPLRFEEMKINITMPEVDKINLKGAGKVFVNGFTEDNLKIKVLGAIKVKADVNARNLALYLSGASELSLSGEGTKMDAKIIGASKFDGYDFKVKDALVEASGASKARVYVIGRLEIDEGLASKVSYKGNPTEVIKD